MSTTRCAHGPHGKCIFCVHTAPAIAARRHFTTSTYYTLFASAARSPHEGVPVMDSLRIDAAIQAAGVREPWRRLALKHYFATQELPPPGTLQASTRTNWRDTLHGLGGMSYEVANVFLTALLDPKPAALAHQRQYDPMRQSPDPQSPEAMAYYYPGHQALPFVRK